MLRRRSRSRGSCLGEEVFVVAVHIVVVVVPLVALLVSMVPLSLALTVVIVLLAEWRLELASELVLESPSEPI